MKRNLIPFVIPVGLVNQLCPQQRNMFPLDWRIIKLPSKAEPYRCFQSNRREVKAKTQDVRWGERKFQNSGLNDEDSIRNVVIPGLSEGGWNWVTKVIFDLTPFIAYFIFTGFTFGLYKQPWCILFASSRPADIWNENFQGLNYWIML